MPRVVFREKLVDVERFALARLKRVDAFVDLLTELPQLFNMRQQLPTDLLLISFRQGRRLSYGVLKRFHNLRHSGVSCGQ